MCSRKRLYFWLSLLVAVLLVAGCGATAAPTQAPAAATPTAAAPEATTAPAEEATEPPVGGGGIGTIRVGTEAAFPPFENKDENGVIVGFDIDLMNAIAAEAGFEVEFVDTPFDGIFVALQSGDFDAVISAATITDERKQIVDFSDPYFEAGLAIAVRADTDYQSPDDLQGQAVGVQLGTTGDVQATELFGEDNVQRYDDVLLAFQALINGDVEAVINDLPVSQGYVAANPDANLRLFEGMITSEQYGIAVNKGRPEVLEAINAGLAAIRANGTYDDLYAKWITAGGEEAGAGEESADIGTIRVGTEAAFPPFENKDENGVIVGFDIDLMNAIAAEAGFEVEFVDTPFDGIFVALQSGEFDAVASATTITDERKQIVDFSDPYFEAGLALAVRSDSDYQAPADLEGQPIGVQLGTTGDITATEMYGEANVQRYDDVLLAFQALINGDVEAVVNDLPVSQGYVAANPDANLRLIEGMLTSEQYGIAVNKGRPEVLEAINAGLAAVRASGVYDELYQQWIVGGAVAEGCGGASNLLAVEALDDFTVQITLCRPDPAMPYKMAFGSMAMHSPANLEAFGGGGGLGVSPVGTGPYTLTEWVRDDHMTLEANPSYWDEPAKTAIIVMRPIPEAAARFLELQAGTVDAINNLGTDDFPVAEADANLQVLPRPPYNVGYLYMNRDTEPFTDQRVRQAVGMCLDRQALVDAFYPPTSLIAEQFIAPGIFGYTEGFQWNSRDIEAAKALLAEAGYPDGITATLSLRDVVRAYMPEPAKVAEAIQAQLAECNVTVDLNVVESGAYLDAAAAGDYELGLLGWLADYPDATNWLDFHFTGTGAGDQFGTPFSDIVDLLAEAAASADPAVRQPLYDQVNELLKEYAIMVPIAYGGSAIAATAELEGLLASPLNQEVWALVSKPGMDTIVYAKNADAPSLDCSDETDGEAFEVCQQIFEGLLGFKAGTTEVEPVLATSYESNEDATVWTFHLREGVTFSDGTPFDAAAVITNIERQWDPENPLHVGRTGEFYYFTAFFGGFKGQ